MLHSTYNGCEIHVHDQDGFWYFLDEDRQRVSVESLQQARQKIDRRLHTRKTGKKLKLKVLDERGEEHTVTGINLNTYRFSGVRESIQHVFYPNTPEIAALIAQLQIAKEVVGSLQQKLRDCQFTPRFSKWNHRLEESTEKYNEAMTQLEAIYVDLVKDAKELDINTRLELRS